MAGTSDRELSVEEAKNRLRKTTEDVLPSAYIRRHPYAVLGIAFAIGFLLARHPARHLLLARAALSRL